MVSLPRSIRRLWTPDFRNPFDAFFDARLLLYQPPAPRDYDQHRNTKSNSHDESIEIEQTLQLLDKACRRSDSRRSEGETITQRVRNV